MTPSDRDQSEFLIDSILDPAGSQDTVAGEYNRDGTRRRVGPLRARAARIREPAKRRFRRLAREEGALRVVERLPEAGEEVVLILDGTFHGFDLITAVLRLADPVRCTDAWLSTMSINKTHANHLLSLGDEGHFDRLALLVSEVFAQQDKPVWNYLNERFPVRGWRVHANRNHTKVVALKFEDGSRVVMHGSLNLRRCHAYEQVFMSRDADLFTFFVDFIREALGKA